MKELTESEKAAIVYYVYTGCKDRKKLYIIAYGPEKANKLTEKSLPVILSKWFNSHKIQDGIRLYQEQKKIDERRIIEEFQRNQETESTNGTTKPPTAEDINFLDPEEFLKHANQVANSCKDEKERRAWLEMIAKYMGYKDQNDSENTEIKRYYIMKTCETCEIYNKCRSCPVDVCPK
jgi:hypothetical protein